jgi:RNA polymerase sigma-70 factor (ECF subfamily)
MEVGVLTIATTPVTLTQDLPGRISAFRIAEVRARVEMELRKVPEPYRSTVILRDLEDMSYEEIAEVLEISLGTVKSRLTRGREALKRRLAGYVREVGPELGLLSPEEEELQSICKLPIAREGLEVKS